ncbi:MAG: response regulator [Gammaproteobacteria bacterium]|nr:MAG: response regulator [Gammaproteobacteria bacterium]
MKKFIHYYLRYFDTYFLNKDKNMKKKEQKTHPKHALLIEDNKPCQIIMTHFLQQLNYKVDLVDEGQKAVKMAQDKLYDLIISDVRIKGLSGEEVIPLLRESKNEDTVIIVWSAFVNKKNEFRYLIWEADAALTKPCTIDDLKITIDECLKRRRIKSESFDIIEKIKEKWLECGGQINLFEELFHLPNGQLCILIEVVEDIKGYRQWEYLSRSAITEN